jgi:predicted aldo/keto reductase-like oxidoreductase
MTASFEGVGKLGFGAMRLPLTEPGNETAIDIEQVKAMIDEFISRGGTYIDTAFVYHEGCSETALNEALVKRYPRGAYTLATKCLAWTYHTKEQAQACLPTSLERLGVDYID